MSDSHGAHAAHGHGHAADHHGDQPHATSKFYWIIGIILAILTAVEVAVFYVEALAPVLIPILVVLSIAKFVLVVQYFMHLKWDHAVFGRVFWAPLFLAVLVVIGMILLFHILPRYGKFV
jgi:cytochrome c oxidase subunit IV